LPPSDIGWRTSSRCLWCQFSMQTRERGKTVIISRDADMIHRVMKRPTLRKDISALVKANRKLLDTHTVITVLVMKQLPHSQPSRIRMCIVWLALANSAWEAEAAPSPL